MIVIKHRFLSVIEDWKLWKSIIPHTLAHIKTERISTSQTFTGNTEILLKIMT